MAVYPPGFELNDPKSTKIVKDSNGGLVALMGEDEAPLLLPSYSLDPITGAVTGMKGPTGSEFLVVSPDAPDDGDGRPDGTIYIQTAA